MNPFHGRHFWRRYNSSVCSLELQIRHQGRELQEMLAERDVNGWVQRYTPDMKKRLC